MAKKLKDLNVAIVTHEYFKGSAQELRDFLVREGIARVFYVAHLFSYAKGRENVSYLEDFKEGKLDQRIKSLIWPTRNELILYVRDFLNTLWFFLTTKDTFDFYVGSDSFNAILGLILRALGKVDKVAFFTIDYIMHGRFNNFLLDWIYVKMDRIAFYGSDYTWNVSDRISRQRVKELGKPAKAKIQFEVPIGVPIEDARKVQVKRKKNVLVYSGSLREGFGLFRAMEAMPALVKKFPDLELRIIGEGPIGKDLRKMAKKLGVSKNVNFLGFINTTNEREKWLRLLKESTLGLAIYDDTENTYKQFSDVTKPKDYMAANLPIITTSVIPFSEVVKRKDLGRVVEDEVDSVVSSISELLGSASKRAKIEKNIEKFSENTTWDSIFRRVFKKMQVKITKKNS